VSQIETPSGASDNARWPRRKSVEENGVAVIWWRPRFPFTAAVLGKRAVPD
jgi:hypothetical protein